MASASGFDPVGFYLFTISLGLPYIVPNIEPVRFIEYSMVWEALEVENVPMNVLEVGSGKSAFSFYLLSRYPKLTVRLTDLPLTTENANFLQLTQQTAMKLRGRVRLEGGCIVETQDARRLTYKDNTMDRVYSISVIEHIPEEGDISAMREMGRVVREGGRLVVSVPYGREFAEEFGIDSSARYYQRRYDQRSLERRLIHPSGLRLVEIKYFGDRTRVPFRLYYRHRLVKGLLFLLAPVLSSLFLQPVSEERGRCACVVLEKG